MWSRRRGSVIHGTCSWCMPKQRERKVEGWRERNGGWRYKDDQIARPLWWNNLLVFQWGCVDAYMCVHVCIWIRLALGGVDPVWHALSAWLNSFPVLEVLLSLHMKSTHTDRHTTLPTESSLQGYPKFLLAFLPSLPHVIIMDCVRILNLSSLELFYPPSLYYSAFFPGIHLFKAHQLTAEDPLRWPLCLFLLFAFIQMLTFPA